MKKIKFIADEASTERNGTLVDGLLISNYDAVALILLPAKEKGDCPCIVLCYEAEMDDLPKNMRDKKIKEKVYVAANRNWANISNAFGKKLLA